MKVVSFIFTLLCTVPTLGFNGSCTCPCACKTDGTKLKNLINCFAKNWSSIAATDDNSNLVDCNERDVIYCRTTKDETFCKFDGTNNLVESSDDPSCWYSCGVYTCNSFLIANTQEQVKCLKDLFADSDHYLRSRV